MKYKFLLAIILILNISEINAQKQRKLIGLWSSTSNKGKYLLGEEKKGYFQYGSTKSIAEKCNCTTLIKEPFTWLSKNGSLYFAYIVDGFVISTIITDKTNSISDSSEYNLATIECNSYATKVLNVLKRDFIKNQHGKFILAGNTLVIVGDEYKKE